MRLRSRNSWLLTLALVAGIASFTMTGAVYADGHGCHSSSTSCFEEAGTCGFISVSEGDFCVCEWENPQGQHELTPTCECSTGEHGPCDPNVEG